MVRTFLCLFVLGSTPLVNRLWFGLDCMYGLNRVFSYNFVIVDARYTSFSIFVLSMFLF